MDRNREGISSCPHRYLEPKNALGIPGGYAKGPVGDERGIGACNIVAHHVFYDHTQNQIDGLFPGGPIHLQLRFRAREERAALDLANFDMSDLHLAGAEFFTRWRPACQRRTLGRARERFGALAQLRARA